MNRRAAQGYKATLKIAPRENASAANKKYTKNGLQRDDAIDVEMSTEKVRIRRGCRKCKRRNG